MNDYYHNAIPSFDHERNPVNRQIDAPFFAFTISSALNTIFVASISSPSYSQSVPLLGSLSQVLSLRSTCYRQASCKLHTYSVFDYLVTSHCNIFVISHRKSCISQHYYIMKTFPLPKTTSIYESNKAYLTLQSSSKHHKFPASMK